MRIHAIQTGTVKVKSAQVEGRGHGPIDVFLDSQWSEWLPTYVWVIEHREGIIVVDTGQGAHLLDHTKEMHPYIRWEVGFRIERDQEIGPQLRAMGIAPRDIKKVVLTHLHIDHDGGLAHFPNTEILVEAGEFQRARGMLGRIRGYLPNRWPKGFDPTPIQLESQPFGPFARSRHLTQAGDVTVVATPGHTANHISVVAQDDGLTYFLAGDTSYNQALMIAGKPDGVNVGKDVSLSTLASIRVLSKSRPTIYLPTHDPESATRLANRQIIPQ